MKGIPTLRERKTPRRRLIGGDKRNWTLPWTVIAFGVCSALVLIPAFGLRISRAFAQESERSTEEVVANLSAGRVIILVVKDAIIIGGVENPVEAETRPPTPVQLGSERAGVILGSVDWFSPSSQQEIARLDEDLPHLRSTSVSLAPHLQSAAGGDAATDIQSIGQGFLERINTAAKNLHAKVDLPSTQPIAELLIADYLAGYGPEVWEITYLMKQTEEQRDYWSTRVLMPQYVQLWPPDKGQPHTLLEFDYPPENAATGVLDLLRQKDQRLQKLTSSDETMANVTDLILRGDAPQIPAADAIQFLRGAFAALAPDSRQTMAVIGKDTGFQWIVRPPPEPQRLPPAEVQETPQQNRPAGVPSLLNPHRTN